MVGHSLSHGRLACRQQQHWFWHNQQTLTTKCYRFPFNTSSLAEFSDCGLIRLHVLVVSHIVPCEYHMSPYYRWISCFSLCGRTHFCFNILWNNLFFLLFIKSMYLQFGRWGVHLTIRAFWTQPNHHHPARLAIVLLCIKLPIFRFKKTTYNMTSSYTCGIPTNHTRIIPTFLC